jgi:hypothetical protein
MTGTVAVTAVIPDTEVNALEQRLIDEVLERVHGGTSPWVNIDQAADYLGGWPKKRLYNLVSKGEIPHRKQAAGCCSTGPNSTPG